MSYKTKAQDSFKTKMSLFIYDYVINDKTRFELNDFKSFKITQDLVKEYTTVYWQQEMDYQLKNKSIRDIYSRITKTWKENEKVIKELQSDYVTTVFPSIFPENEFNSLIKVDKCHYCGITKSQIQMLGTYRQLNKKNLRGWNLEIDRLDSNFEYILSNCVMCCYWCNNAKTDEFTEDEFKTIAQSISSVWKVRIEKALDIRFQERFIDDVPGIRVIKNNERNEKEENRKTGET